MVSLKTKILTEGKFWFANFTIICLKWPAKRQSRSAVRETLIRTMVYLNKQNRLPLRFKYWLWTCICLILSAQLTSILTPPLYLPKLYYDLWSQNLRIFFHYTLQCLRKYYDGIKWIQKINPANIYLLEVNNGNTRKRCEICSKLTIKTPKLSSISIVYFEQVNVIWEDELFILIHCKIFKVCLPVFQHYPWGYSL